MDLLIVGLDGLSFNMLERFDIELPYFDRVRGEGISGDLMSVDTPTTFPAWTSFATGKDPGSHGISDMITQDSDYSVHAVSHTPDEPSICDFFDNGVFVNLPTSTGRIPASENTHVVSAFGAKDKAEAVADEMKDLPAYEDYIVSHNPKLKATPKRYLRHVIEISEARKEFSRQAFERYDPDVGFVLFSTPDWAGHLLSGLSSEAQRKEFYTRLLTAVDSYTEELAGFADNVVMLSDHGFERKRGTIHVNNWLRDQGYLVEKQGDSASASDLTMDVAMAVAKRSDLLYGIMQRIHNRILALDWGSSLLQSVRPDVDYERTTAWQLRYTTIYVNDDRFDTPTVEDPERLRREIRDGLRDLTGDDGKPIFRDVVFPEEAYNDPGPDAPDVIARPAPGYHPLRAWSPKGGVTSPTSSYEHRYRGIFVADGPLFESGTVEGMDIIDVLPTVMAALGESLSPDFDGEARTDVLAGQVEPTVRPAADVPEVRIRTVDEGSAAEREEVVEERLADLGYLE
ncbi:MAG: alkaline phosphatase family protein [Salinigranum sp.]